MKTFQIIPEDSPVVLKVFVENLHISKCSESTIEFYDSNVARSFYQILPKDMKESATVLSSPVINIAFYKNFHFEYDFVKKIVYICRNFLGASTYFNEVSEPIM